MKLKIELNEAGRVDHVYKIFSNQGEDPIDPNPDLGLEIDEGFEADIDLFINNHDLLRRVYEYKAGKFKKRDKAKFDADIIDWVDTHPIELPEDYNKTKDGLPKDNPKKLEDLTPEELNAIAVPIPTYEDFLDLPENFVKKDLYKEKHNIDF